MDEKVFSETPLGGKLNTSVLLTQPISIVIITFSSLCNLFVFCN